MSAERRDEGWLEGLFRAHHRAVLAYAVRRVPDEADDVLSEVFAAAWRHRDRVPDEPLPWLYRTAAHQVQHRRRSTARRTRLAVRLGGLGGEGSPAAVIDSTDDVVDRVVSAQRVARLLDALPPRDAEILRLSAWEQLDAASIAYVLSISPTAVRVRLHRARRRAEQLLAAPDPEASAHVAPPLVPEEIR
jgi:RNA polymerase sigma-70 factor, ECF subfamily